MTSRSRFAATTEVPAERSRAEIEMTLKRYGATRYGYMEEPGRAAIAFELAGRNIRFVMNEPPMDAASVAFTDGGRKREPAAARAAWEQACRQRWRALALVIKAKLEAAASGIVSIESEFLAQIVLPSGRTVAEEALPVIEAAYASGKAMPLLPGYESRRL